MQAITFPPHSKICSGPGNSIIRPPSLPSLPLYAALRGYQIRFALLCKVSLTRPTVSRRSSPICIPSVPETAKQHSIVPPTNQSVLSFSVWVQACQVVSLLFAVILSLSPHVLLTRDILLATEQPKNAPRVSYLTTQYPPIVGLIS